MNKKEIIEKIEGCGLNCTYDKTILGTYADIPRKSLCTFKDDINDVKANRNTKGWPKAQVMVISYDPNYSKEDCLQCWKFITKYFDNQVMLFEEPQDNWVLYGKDGEPIGNENDLINKFSVITMSNKNITFEYYRLLTAIRTKPFVLLAGISGTGKSRIVRKLAQATVTEDLQKCHGYNGGNFDIDRWTLQRPANFELIQVKPNWHNSMDVVGYLSNIPSPHYVFTPFVEFVARAWQHLDVPFFLCLDEMNLAPVEEYFAEFLSAIESRSNVDGNYQTDPIIKGFTGFDVSDSTSLSDTMVAHLIGKLDTNEKSNLANHFKNDGLTLPKNLIVIGTVNMDETTYSFSRKVLDRAMSIEMNDVDYDSFIMGATDGGLKEISKNPGLNKLLTDRHVDAHDVIPNLDGLSDGGRTKTVVNYLKRVNKLLDGSQFKLGYRAANEALIYVKAAEDFNNHDTKSALDDFSLMKILSRLEGDEYKLSIDRNEKRLKESELDVEQDIEINGKITFLSCLRTIINKDLGNGNTTLKSVEKLDIMIEQLQRNHFVSYWN